MCNKPSAPIIPPRPGVPTLATMWPNSVKGRPHTVWAFPDPPQGVPSRVGFQDGPKASQTSGGTLRAPSDTLATDASTVRSLASSGHAAPSLPPQGDSAAAGIELQKAAPTYAPQLMASAHPPSATLPPASAHSTMPPRRDPGAARGTL